MRKKKKIYSFRLKETDDDLRDFLQNLSKQFSSESEAIRQMLLYAHKNLIGENKNHEHIKRILDEIKHIKEIQDKNYSEIIKTLQSSEITRTEKERNEKNDKEEEKNKIAQDTANALLGGFGMDFD